MTKEILKWVYINFGLVCYIGATLSKGLNRGVATLVAGGLALGAHQLASLSGRTIEPILLATFVFVTGNLT